MHKNIDFYRISRLEMPDCFCYTSVPLIKKYAEEKNKTE